MTWLAGTLLAHADDLGLDSLRIADKVGLDLSTPVAAGMDNDLFSSTIEDFLAAISPRQEADP